MQHVKVLIEIIQDDISRMVGCYQSRDHATLSSHRIQIGLDLQYVKKGPEVVQIFCFPNPTCHRLITVLPKQQKDSSKLYFIPN